MKIVRIVFCILSCACVAASILVGVLVDWPYFFILAAAAALFGALMLLAKNKADPPAEAPDFMNSDEENARINAENEEKK